MSTKLFQNAKDFQVYQAGEVIFREGQPGDVMYVVKEGEVEIQVNGKTLEIVGEGGIVGEMALLDSEPRSATVMARVTTQLVPISPDRFKFLIQQTPYFATEVMRVMAHRIRAMDALMND
jgi:CRP/FNR family cyclic AMP-dependent transcriptional regulator